MNKIVKIIFLDILKNKIVIAYMLMLAVLSWSSFALEDNSAKGLLTILNVILFTVPLVSVLFATIYIYNSSEFIELLLSQPVKRKKIRGGLFSGLSLSLVIAFLLGSGIPLFIYSANSVDLMMIVFGYLISVVLAASALMHFTLARDKAKGIGISFTIWLYFGLTIDRIVLFLLCQLSVYPIDY